MQTRTTIALIALFVLALVGLTLWFQFGGTQPTELSPVEQTGYIPRIIEAKHQFKNGVHTIAGEIALPTPCYLLETDSIVQVREPDVDKAVLQFRTQGDDEICAQVVTDVRFKEVFNAHENADIDATWNGSPVTLNLIPARPDEDLDAFELFIKG